MTVGAGSPRLEATGVGVELAGRTVLRDAALRVGRGEVVALSAPSGAGKSTLLRCVVRLVPVHSGTITLHGAPVDAIPAPELRRRVALVAQAPAMLPGTVADNVAYAAGAGTAAAVEDALGAAGLDPAFAARAAGELSGGERARVALARALARGPSVLLLDEPSAALDGDAAARLGSTLRRLAGEGLGICVATHDAGFAARFADRETRLP